MALSATRRSQGVRESMIVPILPRVLSATQALMRGTVAGPCKGKETTSAAYFSRAMVRKAGSIRSCSSHQREFAMASSRPGPEMASASLRNR